MTQEPMTAGRLAQILKSIPPKNIIKFAICDDPMGDQGKEHLVHDWALVSTDYDTPTTRIWLEKRT